MTSYLSFNSESTASASPPASSPSVFNISDYIHPAAATTISSNNNNITTDMATTERGGCGGGDAGWMGCNVTQTAWEELTLCRRLAPPPVPPWLRDSPERLQQLTKHCRSWTLYQELCKPELGNSSWHYPVLHETVDGEMAEMGPAGIQWVVPVLALIVVLLLLVLGIVLYKYYSRPNKKRMYRVSGAAYRFKPPQGGLTWAGGPLVESETTESYLSQSGSATDPAFHHGRSPVCRLLEQTQYVATPTEDQHRPRPTGPPAFASPAYFLPALSWLRLPALRQAWPGDNGDGAVGSRAVYNAARPVQCECGETTHQWSSDGDNPWADDGPEYSEIWEGQSQYSALGQVPSLPGNGIGPYEYEMQETSNGRALCNCGPVPHRPFRPQGGRLTGNEHRYEKLWQCGEGEDGALHHDDSCSSNAGSSENGWLSRYRLPSPCVPASDPVQRRENGPHHAHRTDKRPIFHSGSDGGAGHAVHRDRGLRAEDLTSNAELLPCECSLGALYPTVSGTWGRAGVSGEHGTHDRAEVKYVNPVYEGRGEEAVPPPHYQGPSSPLSKLWGYIGLSNKS